MAYRPVVLVVLDGWGIAPDGPGNAVSRAKTPRLGTLFTTYPHARLDASGRAVGLPDGVMGNSEVGHLTMGAGLIQYQELVRINDTIADRTFFKNEAFLAAAKSAARGTVHLMGLLSTGGVHADVTHLRALTELLRTAGVKHVVHLFLDGRDMPPRSALELIGKVDAPTATVQGRYWAMDRDKRWERTARAYAAIVDADAPSARSAEEAVRECYAKADCGDELMDPRIVGVGRRIEDRDSVIFFNFRPDRARQLTWALMQPDFTGFTTKHRPRGLTFVTMTDYKVDLPNVRVAFPQQDVTPLAKDLADAGLTQFHTAETEKYAHVTYFFNGGHEPPFKGEERELVPSPKVATYDLQPEMSAAGVADAFARAIAGGRFDFAIVNFANPDMVGHTGDIAATERAMVATDAAVGKCVDAVLAAGGAAVITADHGNAEEMLFPDGSRNTQHSINPVPVVVVAKDAARLRMRDGGLQDIAPTLLELLGMSKPQRMTGSSLLSSRR
jgi:2,3-bisphosphoglycerate-independent phosphoglycerate mutase